MQGQRYAPMPPKTPWREREDPKTGKLYYYNKDTMMVQWKKPKGIDIVRSRSQSRSPPRQARRRSPHPKSRRSSAHRRQKSAHHLQRAFSEDAMMRATDHRRSSSRGRLRRHASDMMLMHHREIKQEQYHVAQPAGSILHSTHSRESPESTTEPDETDGHSLLGGRSQARGTLAIATIDEEMRRLRRERDYLRKELKLQTQAHAIEMRTAQEEAIQLSVRIERELQRQHEIELKSTISELESEIDQQEERHARRYAKMEYEKKKELQRLEDSLREKYEEQLAEIEIRLSHHSFSQTMHTEKKSGMHVEKKSVIQKVVDLQESNDTLTRSQKDMQEENKQLKRKIKLLEKFLTESVEKHQKALENNAKEFYKQEETYQNIIEQMSTKMRQFQKKATKRSHRVSGEKPTVGGI
uniref:WW domain-containing protein n=1 Tax=Lotharella globosa TaxID=91324 RepID=A0A7S3Z7Q4_9EUKA